MFWPGSLINNHDIYKQIKQVYHRKPLVHILKREKILCMGYCLKSALIILNLVFIK